MAQTELGKFRLDSAKEVAFIPATASNVAALEDIGQRIDELRLELARFLRQDTIERSLSRMREAQPGAISFEIVAGSLERLVRDATTDPDAND